MSHRCNGEPSFPDGWEIISPRAIKLPYLLSLTFMACGPDWVIMKGSGSVVNPSLLNVNLMTTLSGRCEGKWYWHFNQLVSAWSYCQHYCMLLIWRAVERYCGFTVKIKSIVGKVCLLWSPTMLPGSGFDFA